eukprot:TRINITY_DN9723_c0_g1_i2.p1 TRINITY_DN9723_c0_g1~~TRINITY_DN9723_c0_g1_i2.p1  ORF type:complete len:106 (-),score=27.62 TRINITY_DN9723_c0_g1_i2:88-405(-)
MENSTRYEGYSKDDPTIKNFWSFIHALDMSKKRKFLSFVTGSDRVPLRGLAELNFTISKNGKDQSRLPSAHTCFNYLLLPDYRTKEVLEERLLYSLTHSKGFGLR